MSFKKKLKDKNMLNQNASLADMSSKKYLHMPPALTSKGAEDHLMGYIDKNLFKLEQEVAFFSFAIKEIEDITNQ